MRLSRSETILLLSGVAVTVLLLIPLPFGMLRRWPALARDLTDFCHPLAFAWLTHMAFKALRIRQPQPSLRPFVWAMAGAAGYGAATEVIQSLVGRQPSLSDFCNDLLGAGAVLLLHARAERSATVPRLGLAVAAGMIAVIATAPLATTIAAYAHRQVRAPVLWRAESPLFARLARYHDDGQQRLMILEPPGDWRAWRFLEVDISNPMASVHPVIVRVHDREHDQRHEDRYNGRFDLAPESEQTLRIPLERIRGGPSTRTLDLSAIRGVVIFSAMPGGKARFEVSEVRLAGSRS